MFWSSNSETAEIELPLLRGGQAERQNSMRLGVVAGAQRLGLAPDAVELAVAGAGVVAKHEP